VLPGRRRGPRPTNLTRPVRPRGPRNTSVRWSSAAASTRGEVVRRGQRWVASPKRGRSSLRSRACFSPAVCVARLRCTPYRTAFPRARVFSYGSKNRPLFKADLAPWPDSVFFFERKGTSTVWHFPRACSVRMLSECLSNRNQNDCELMTVFYISKFYNFNEWSYDVIPIRLPRRYERFRENSIIVPIRCEQVYDITNIGKSVLFVL